MVRTSTRSHRSQRVAGVFTVLVALVVALTSYAFSADRLPPSGPGVPITRAADDRPVDRPTPGRQRSTPSTGTAPERGSGALGAADGVIPDGTTLSPFDTEHLAIVNLDPELRTAIRSAATDAEADGVEVVITSGWRSRRYQQALLDEAVVTYGSETEARRWVNTPEKSTHVTGDAVDVGYTEADYWLIQYGYEYGLCQTYANEIWHFELAVEPGETCPAPLSDASAG